MTASPPPPGLPSAAARPASSAAVLDARPLLRELLEARGVRATPLPGEAVEAFDNRLATALMALFRDTARREAFEALYALAGPSVLRWISSLLRGAQGAHDPAELLQDTFVNVYRYPGGFRDDHEGSFRVWVRTIAGNLIRRRGQRGHGRFSFQELPDGLQEPEDARGTPLARAQDGEEHARLRSAWILFLCHYARAWQELGQRDRRTLHLVEVEGLSYQEAGEVLGVGRSNMKMIVFRSRRRIARRMRQAMTQALLPSSAPPRGGLAGEEERARRAAGQAASWSGASGAA